MGLRPGQAKGPWVGLSGGSGSGGLEIVIALFDPTAGLPSDPAIGDRYLATATANGWSADYIYEWTGELWVGSEPYAGRTIFVLMVNQMYAYDFGSWRLYQDFWFKPVIAIYDNSSSLPGTITE